MNLKDCLSKLDYNYYLEIKDEFEENYFNVKGWLNEDAIETGEYEVIDIGLPLEEALLGAIDAVKNDGYIVAEAIEETAEPLDYTFEVLLNNGILQCSFNK